MQLARLKRLLKLIGILQSGKGHNISALAEACGVSRRTAFRDVALLKEAGVPLAFDEQQQRYRIPEQYFLAPTVFTAQEAAATVAVCHELGHRLPDLRPAISAAVKLEGALPQPIRDYLRNTVGSVHVRPQAVAEATTVYQSLLDAIATRKAVRIEYASQETSIATKLSPYKLLFNQHSWYVVGRSSLHRSVKTFLLRHIKSLQPTEDSFKIPRNFGLERYLGNAWNMDSTRPRQATQEVVIRFSPAVAKNVASVTWHRGQRISFQDDGSMLFQADVSGLTEIASWVLGYGGEAVVLKPVLLARLVVQRAREILGGYFPHSELLPASP